MSQNTPQREDNMAHRPPPLTPPESDLQDFPFMPLQVARLRDSDLAAEEDPEACWYAVLLWAAAWHQLPAGSLPDNDQVLMRLVGLGRDQKTWRKFKNGALRGFILCEDGRFYHPVVAEQVIEAWNGKIRQRHRTLCAAIRKHNERNPEKTMESPSFEDWSAAGCPATVSDLVTQLSLVTGQNVTRDKLECHGGVACETPSKRKGQGQGQGQGDSIDRTFSDENVCADPISDQHPPAPPEFELNGGSEPVPALRPEHIVEEWNALAGRVGKPRVRDLTPERRQLLKGRISQYGIDDFVSVFAKIERSPFLRGDEGWRGCTFDWIMKKSNFQKALEGNYDE